MQLHPLPATVPLVRAETIDSYLARLAAANHIPVPEMRVHVGMPAARNGRVDLHRLSAMTGHQPDRLRDLIIGAAPLPGRARVSPPPAGRPACRRCTASRGIQGDVHRVTADLRACRPHRRWLGALGDPQREQYDLSPLPEIVHAQRRHHRLLHRHGRDVGRTALFWATHINDRWTERGDWDQHRVSGSSATSPRFPTTPTRPTPWRRCSTTRRSSPSPDCSLASTGPPLPVRSDARTATGSTPKSHVDSRSRTVHAPSVNP